MPLEGDVNENFVTLCSYRTASDEQAQKQANSIMTKSDQPSAVEIRRVRLSYGRGKSAKPS